MIQIAQARHARHLVLITDTAEQVRPINSARTRAASTLLERMFDTIGHCFAFFDLTGKLRHANRALHEHIAHSPEGDVVRAELHDFGTYAAGLAKIAVVRGGVERITQRTLRYGIGEYLLDALFVEGGVFGSEASVVVDVHVPPPDPFTPVTLRERFNLTRKQSAVARLVAQGLRNDEIALRLCVSEHTIRHHIEQIKMKLQAPTRSAIGSIILNGAPLKHAWQQ